MEEVDSILIYTLKQIGCDVDSNIAQLSPSQIIKCVTRCFELIRPELEFPSYDGSTSMSGRYKIASQIAQLITDLGFKEEIGCQSFLYPTEADTRKMLIFLVEKLPRDIDSDVGDKIETLLAKLAHEEEQQQEAQEQFSSGITIDGIRLPSAVDVNTLPKETLKFYASHLADITFAKEREKFKKAPENAAPVVVPTSPVAVNVDDDDDFGDPDEGITQEIVQQVPIPKPRPRMKEKPKISDKPVVALKPPIKEKPKLLDNSNLQQNTSIIDAEAEKQEELRKAADQAEAAARVKALQEDTKFKVKTAKAKEKALNEMNQNISTMEDEVLRLKNEIEAREKDLERQRKTKQLLSSSDDGLEKVKKAVESQTEKLLNLANQWEKHRQPLIEEIRSKRAENASKITETAKQKDEIRSLKTRLKEMGQEAKEKEQLYAQLLSEYEKMPKDLNRSAYTKRICEIIGNIKKQKREITNVIKDTKEIQKDINTLSGRLDRTFAHCEQLIFKDAEKDKNVAQSYKLLVSIHSDFSRIIKSLEDMGTLKRLSRDLEDKLEFEKGKNVGGKLDRLSADLMQMKKENQILQATLRDPSFVADS